MYMKSDSRNIKNYSHWLGRLRLSLFTYKRVRWASCSMSLCLHVLISRTGMKTLSL